MKCYELQKEDKWKVGDILKEGDSIRLIIKSGNYCFNQRIKKLYHSSIFQPETVSGGYCANRKAPKNDSKTDFQHMNG